MDGELHPSGSTLENQVDDVCQRTAQGTFVVFTTTGASSDFGVGLDAVDSLLQGLVQVNKVGANGVNGTLAFFL